MKLSIAPGCLLISGLPTTENAHCNKCSFPMTTVRSEVFPEHNRRPAKYRFARNKQNGSHGNLRRSFCHEEASSALER